MIDTHAHLDFESYDQDRDETIARFFENGGRAIINVGCSEQHIKNSLKLAADHEQTYFTVGVHPEEENMNPGEVANKIKKFLGEKKAVAIGEIGLDYFHNDKNKNWQRELFESQLGVAAENEMPVVIHCRQAYEDMLEIISNFNPPAGGQISKLVIHCYEGNIEQTKKFLEIPNVYFSFTGNITFAKDSSAEIFDVIRMVPLEKIMVETDCPFLAPNPHRGKRNEPAFVKHVIEKIAEVREMKVEEVERITDQNAINFFNLDV